MLTNKLHTYTPLPYTYNIKNSSHLISDLKEIPYDLNLRLASLDITNMYTNIPTGTVLSTIKEICQNNYVMKEIEADILRLSEAVINQTTSDSWEKHLPKTTG